MHHHLRKHQRENLAFLRGRQGAAILDEQGLGKSCSVIAHLEDLQRERGRPLRALVICPSSIMHSWSDEVKKFATTLAPCIVEGTRAKRIKLLRSNFDQGVIFIVNYEFARTLRGPQGRGPDNLSRMGWDVVVADEMTRIKTRTTATARALHDFVKNSPKTIRIGMTGTPITNSPLDAFSQFAFVDPTIFGPNYAAFEKRYATTRTANYGNGSFRQVTGYQNLSELTQRIHRCSIRHEKATCLDLPAKTHQRIDLDLHRDQRRVYDDLRHELIAEVEGVTVTAANALAKLSKLQQVTSGFVYSGDPKRAVPTSKANPKVEAALDLVRDASGSVVIWCRFRACLDLVSSALKDAKISHEVFRSDLPGEDRGRLTREFQAGKFRVMVAHTCIAQFGLTWTKASTAIFFSMSWSVEELMQAQDRIHRMGQTDPCIYYYLIGRGTVDEACLASVLEKKEVGRAIAGKDFAALAQGKVGDHARTSA